MHDAGVRLPLLLQPMVLRGIFARNRIVVSPMCQYKSEHGGPTDWHLVTLGKYAIGGAGIVFTEETAVEERGRKTHECAGIYSDGHVGAYRRITDFIRGQGAIPAIQLGHAGRKASSDLPWNDFKPLTESDAARGLKPWRGISASAVPDPRPGSPAPIPMSVADIRQMIETWRDAALRSIDAGFDICEFTAPTVT
jgi:2,4-dienoyl-CoA reductase-like NADH-dependent reductase (Old Yellow Enzyme family)